MAVLVTGGAGYIGSHAVAQLLDRGEEVIIIDNLQKGHHQAILGGILYEGDLRDELLLDRVFKENKIEAVIHFAADSLVGESVEKPSKYYGNNLVSGLCLLEKMRSYGVEYIVFSSTAAVYGEPEKIPIEERDKTEPTNPYGETKLSFERALKWFDRAYGIKYTSLRYFNAAGAHPEGKIGEDHRPETHLIPIILEVALGLREKIWIYGDDYPTKDGTCIRDYIHVSDLAQAHILALDRMRKEKESAVYNLGNGQGFSVQEVIEAAREVTGHPIPAEIGKRRAGDPAILVASSKKIQEELNWKPRFNDLKTIIETAWRWHQNHPKGYNR